MHHSLADQIVQRAEKNIVTQTRLRVIIADDHTLVRRGIRKLLTREQGIDVVAEATNGRDAVTLARRLQPDIVIMDVAMPEMDGIEATREIEALQMPIKTLMVSMYGGAALVEQALKEGAGGYILKTSLARDLLRGVQAVVKGDIFLSQALATQRQASA